jgi:hypothetical protein
MGAGIYAPYYTGPFSAYQKISKIPPDSPTSELNDFLP